MATEDWRAVSVLPLTTVRNRQRRNTEEHHRSSALSSNSVRVACRNSDNSYNSGSIMMTSLVVVVVVAGSSVVSATDAAVVPRRRHLSAHPMAALRGKWRHVLPYRSPVAGRSSCRQALSDNLRWHCHVICRYDFLPPLQTSFWTPVELDNRASPSRQEIRNEIKRRSTPAAN